MQEARTVSSPSQESETEEHPLELPHLRPKPRKKRLSHSALIVNLADCKYPVVKEVVRSLRMGVGKDPNADWDLTWTDSAVSAQTLARMRNYQKINHFPGMFHLSRKNYLARNLARMQKQFPQHYDFHPRTWALPAEYNDLKNYLQKETNDVVIAKPEASCQGRGIFLSKDIADFQFGEHYVVQKYVRNPLLLQGLKFDLRVYALVAGCDPLRVYVYKQGLARLATEAYASPKKDNLGNLYMHLTNYAINKNSSKFEFNHSCERMDVGHKRALSAVLAQLQQNGKDTHALWQRICDSIAKTVIAVQPVLAHTYRSCQPDNLANNMCFELLGFDVMLDQDLRPIILQVNYTPSFATETPLDQRIKQTLIKDTLQLLNLSNKAKQEALSLKKREMMERTLTGKQLWKDRQQRQAEAERLAQKRTQWQQRHLGNFEVALPAPDPVVRQQYQGFLAHAQECYLSNTGGNIKRQSKVPTPMPLVEEAIETRTPQKFTRTDQLERIYMKKPKPMGKVRANRSRVKEDEKKQAATSKRQEEVPPFLRTRPYDSVDKFAVWKQEGLRANTSEKIRTREDAEDRGGTGKAARTAASRVYNVGFREMRPQ